MACSIPSRRIAGVASPLFDAAGNAFTPAINGETDPASAVAEMKDDPRRAEVGRRELLPAGLATGRDSRGRPGETMLKNRTNEILVAAVLVAPFVVIYGWMFIYPTIQMVQLSFTNAPLIGAGEWVGLENYARMFADKVFGTAVWNTTYFVLLTVVPGTAVALAIALMVSPPQGLAAERYSGGVLPALRAAGDGGLDHLGLAAERAVRHRSSRSSSPSSAGR